MMKKLKAIYLLPVFLVLLGGAGFALYNYVINPQMVATKKKYDDWQKAKTDFETALRGYPGYFTAEQQAAEKMYNDYQTFLAVQETMPDIGDEESRTAGMTDPEKTDYAYRAMLNKDTAKKLAAWAKKFGLGKTAEGNIPDFAENFTVTTLPMPGTITFPKPKHVKVELGTYVIKARGINDLAEQIRSKVGFGYCPMYITLEPSSGTGGGGTAGQGTPGGTPGATPKPGAPGVTVTPSRPGGPAAGVGTTAPPAKGSVLNVAMSAAGGMSTARSVLIAARPGADVDAVDDAPAPAPAPKSAPAPAAAPKAAAPGAAPAAAASAKPAPPPAPAFSLVLDHDPASPDYDPKLPRFEVRFKATGYFMARGWSPFNSPEEAAMEMAQAKDKVQNPDRPISVWSQHETSPKLLWFFDFPTKTK